MVDRLPYHRREFMLGMQGVKLTINAYNAFENNANGRSCFRLGNRLFDIRVFESIWDMGFLETVGFSGVELANYTIALSDKGKRCVQFIRESVYDYKRTLLFDDEKLIPGT